MTTSCSPSTKFFIFFIIHTLLAAAQAAPLKVDLSYPNRNDTAAPHYVEWPVLEEESVSNTFDGITVTFSKLSPAGSMVKGDWYKGGIDYDARMVTDGLIGLDGGVVQMTISGLPVGDHTIVTYHNTFGNPATNTFSKLNITLNGSLYTTGLTTTNRVLDNYDAALVYYETTVTTGQDVIITFDGDGTGSNDNAVINGFEIDTVDPTKKAIKPSPANDDEHVDADTGGALLSWTAAAGAFSHDIYFGTDGDTVDSVDSGSPEFMGNQAGVGFEATNLSNFDEYYWRVDEVDSGGVRTHGELWRFRVRHPAFPTAEGYGRYARGGRGGVVYEVTNLNDSGSGSLREGIEAEGPRTIVFRVSGLIVLQSKLILRNPYCTVAGQTAPGLGVCLSNYNFGMLGMQDGIVRFVRVRPGNTADATLDGMGMASSDHSIIDHCSISWSIDEGFSSRSAKNITLQRSIISEALNEAGHDNYPPGTQHGYAASIGGDIGSFHHNLLAHCAGRNWSLAGGLNNAGEYAGQLDIRYNVVYNWKDRTTDGGAMEVNFINNYYKPGAACTEFDVLNPEFEFDTDLYDPSPQRYYVDGNVMKGYYGPATPYAGVDPSPDEPLAWFIVDEPFFADNDYYFSHPTAAEAYADVLSNVGCNRPARDAVDMRVITETRGATFTFRGSATNLPGLIDSQDDVGGWPDYPEITRPADYDSDHDGMPNQWENERAYLDASDPADGNEDYNDDGYTNLEDYLNYLTGDLPPEPPPLHVHNWILY